jgi:hypothetical protein
VRRLASAALLAGLLALLATAAAPPTVLDDFEDPARWKTVPSDGVSLALASDGGMRGGALRLDFDFHGKSGWAAIRRAVSLDLPANYEFTFRIRGDAPVNNLEFKLSDASGQNVWWVNRRNFEFPREWQTVRIKKRHIEFAWGPAGGGELRHAASLEITITAGTGGKGTVWLDELTFEELPPAKTYARTPEVTASSSAPGGDPRRALDGDPKTAWETGAGGDQFLAIDFLEKREFGGLVVDWGNPFAANYSVEASDDGTAWTVLRKVRGGNGGRDYLYLPESESRHLRLRFSGSAEIREVSVQPLEFSASPNAFFERIAKDAPRGSYPRYLRGEQSYWTVIGVDADVQEGLFGEDGTLEAGKGGFSIEPFLSIAGTLVGWSSVDASQSLLLDYLPIPSVTWRRAGISLETTAFAAGEPGRSSLYTRYRVKNGTGKKTSIQLLLAIRPLQVNPSTQFLNAPGGATHVRSIRFENGAVDVDGRRILPLTPPSNFGAATFDSGDVVEYFRGGALPAARSVSDPFGYASGALAYDLALAPGKDGVIDLAIPLHREASPATGPKAFDSELAVVTREWKSKLDRVGISVPADAEVLARTVKSNLAYILINRDGPAIQPGSRSYERSWIRDGSLTSAALLRLGHSDDVKQFVEWFAAHQFDDGKIPCCVDARGADPVPENDSHGEFLYLVAEYGRFTKDREVLSKLWPRVERTVAYIDRLRQQRRTEDYRRPDKLAFFGLLPESISHEGYSSKPVHSYWDDFFALRGLEDAVEIAAMLGRSAEEAKFRAIAAEFGDDLHASIRRTIGDRKIDYIPGSVELADFDPTSTTIALEPGGELGRLPQRELLASFERYFREFRKRETGTDWDAYTPYETRTIGTFVRLGWRDRIPELLDFFLSSRRPASWNQWAEVVGREPRKPRFIGDMPHTWVGSDFIRSFLDMFAYERRGEGSLVLAAGIPETWIEAPGGVGVRGLRTRWGPLDYSLSRVGGEVRMQVSAGELPPGGVFLALPKSLARGAATVNGAATPIVSGEIAIRRLPAAVIVIVR